MALGSPVAKVGTVAAQVVSAIAAAELPQGHWSEVINILLQFVNHQENTNLRIATLQAIGFICESIVRFRHRQFDTILTHVPRNLRFLRCARTRS